MSLNFWLFFQETVWHIVNNVDIKGSEEVPLTVRSPFLEFQVYAKQTLFSFLQVSFFAGSQLDLVLFCHAVVRYDVEVVGSNPAWAGLFYLSYFLPEEP